MKEYITGIQHIGLPTQKLEETLCFYEALGFERGAFRPHFVWLRGSRECVS